MTILVVSVVCFTDDVVCFTVVSVVCFTDDVVCRVGCVADCSKNEGAGVAYSTSMHSTSGSSLTSNANGDVVLCCKWPVPVARQL